MVANILAPTSASCLFLNLLVIFTSFWKDMSCWHLLSIDLLQCNGTKTSRKNDQQVLRCWTGDRGWSFKTLTAMLTTALAYADSSIRSGD